MKKMSFRAKSSPKPSDTKKSGEGEQITRANGSSEIQSLKDSGKGVQTAGPKQLDGDTRHEKVEKGKKNRPGQSSPETRDMMTWDKGREWKTPGPKLARNLGKGGRGKGGEDTRANGSSGVRFEKNWKGKINEQTIHCTHHEESTNGLTGPCRSKAHHASTSTASHFYAGPRLASGAQAG